MDTKAKPYIGVTGLTTETEVNQVLGDFSRAGYSTETPHVPMLGFLVSRDTLNHHLPPNRRYPPIEKLRSLLYDAKGKALAMIHYHEREGDALDMHIRRLFDGTGIHQDDLCRTLQLNVHIPDPAQVRSIKDKFDDMQIVLQLNHKILECHDPDEIARLVQEYGDSIDYVLIDPSGGKGLELDIPFSAAIYRELKEQSPRLTIGFAGGFTSKNVKKRLRTLKSLLGTTDFSIDAEGGLRELLSDKFGDDILIQGEVERYLIDAHTQLA